MGININMNRYVALIPAVFLILIVSGCTSEVGSGTNNELLTGDDALQWCDFAGAIKIHTGGTTGAYVYGTVLYSGVKRCHFSYVLNGEYMHMYVLDEDFTDVWFSGTVQGGTYLDHVVDGECASGVTCEDMLIAYMMWSNSVKGYFEDADFWWL